MHISNQYLMFRHPALQDLDYVWRLDADVELRLGVPCDVFRIAADARAVLGFTYTHTLARTHARTHGRAGGRARTHTRTHIFIT